MTAREVLETQRAQEEEPHEVGASSGPAADQTPSAFQLRARILEMSTVFAELSDGVLRAVARRMRAVSLTARDTLRLNADGGDVVVFVASGQVEESITDGTGKVLLSRRPAPGDMVILPAPRTKDRYVTNIFGITDAVLLTLDRDGLLEGLGPSADSVAAALDKLWEQELSAVEAVEIQRSSRTAAPVVALTRERRYGPSVNVLGIVSPHASCFRRHQSGRSLSRSPQHSPVKDRPCRPHVPVKPRNGE